MHNDAPTVPFLWMEPFPGVTLGLAGVTLSGITPSNLSLLVLDIVWFATLCAVWFGWFAPFGHRNGAKQMHKPKPSKPYFCPTGAVLAPG